MPAIKLPIFSGMVPSVDKHLLNDANAAFSSNTWLYSGALVGMPAKAPLYNMVNPANAVAFRVPIDDSDPSYMYTGYWVEFPDPNTDFIKAPVSGDTFARYYWTAPNFPTPMYNTRARIIAGQPPFFLGLPAPGALNVVVSGGASVTLVSRAYLATFVTAYGEEGPASAPFLVSSAKIDATFTVTLPACLATNMGTDRNITKIRLYRTITAADGTADYYLVTEVTALTTTQTFADTATDATLASNVILASTAWNAPPALQGMIAMPNGIVAGFINNDLYFSEAYRPHAWPASYSISLEHKIIGMGIIGQTLVVCTQGNPVTASGVNPGSITTSKMALFEPCTSKGSIVSTESGVFYASSNGLILVNPGGAENLTKEYISKDKWNEIAGSGKIDGGRLGSAYYAYGASYQGVFQETAFDNGYIQLKGKPGSPSGFILDPVNNNAGFNYLIDNDDILSVTNDMMSGEIVLVKGGKVYWIDQRPGYTTEIYKWQSKVFETPYLTNFAAFKVFLYEDPARVYPNPQNFDINQSYNSATQNAVVRIYAGGSTGLNLILAHEIRKSGELHRLPTGFKADFWQIEFEGMIKIKNFQMATSIQELKSV